MMGHCYHHALSSARRWGGQADDFLALHNWFDESKSITADFRHRALRHHAEGVFMLVIWTCKRVVEFRPMRDRPTAALIQRAGGGRPVPRIAQRCISAA